MKEEISRLDDSGANLSKKERSLNMPSRKRKLRLFNVEDEEENENELLSGGRKSAIRGTNMEETQPAEWDRLSIVDVAATPKP